MFVSVFEKFRRFKYTQRVLSLVISLFNDLIDYRVVFSLSRRSTVIDKDIVNRRKV